MKFVKSELLFFQDCGDGLIIWEQPCSQGADTIVGTCPPATSLARTAEHVLKNLRGDVKLFPVKMFLVYEIRKRPAAKMHAFETDDPGI